MRDVVTKWRHLSLAGRKPNAYYEGIQLVNVSKSRNLSWLTIQGHPPPPHTHTHTTTTTTTHNCHDDARSPWRIRVKGMGPLNPHFILFFQAIFFNAYSPFLYTKLCFVGFKTKLSSHTRCHLIVVSINFDVRCEIKAMTNQGLLTLLNSYFWPTIWSRVDNSNYLHINKSELSPEIVSSDHCSELCIIQENNTISTWMFGYIVVTRNFSFWVGGTSSEHRAIDCRPLPNRLSLRLSINEWHHTDVLSVPLQSFTPQNCIVQLVENLQDLMRCGDALQNSGRRLDTLLFM